ncbi:MAG: hypothetical protein ABMA64_29075, partial [Myxococcota bacterium]
VLRAVAGGVDLPVDYLTRADSGRLRALRQGAVTGVARGDTIEIRIHNVTDAPRRDARASARRRSSLRLAAMISNRRGGSREGPRGSGWGSPGSASSPS